MNPDLLARLRDVHAPLDPPWWPPAPGWWLLLALALVASVLLVSYLRPRLARWRMRRRLLAVLRAIERQHRTGARGTSVAAAVSRLLREAALERFPGDRVAGLHGREWIAFLESRDRVAGRFAALEDALTVAPYRRPHAEHDPAPLLRAAGGWLRAVL